MYFASIFLLLLILPSASVFLEAHSHPTLTLLFLTGKWFTFWSVGIRLFIAGIRQVIQPSFTAEEIFNIHDRAAFPIVRELGFANLCMGLLGICSLLRPEWIIPASVAGGLYYGLAGALHIFRKNKNAKELIAMISDLFLFGVLLIFILKTLA